MNVWTPSLFFFFRLLQSVRYRGLPVKKAVKMFRVKRRKKKKERNSSLHVSLLSLSRTRLDISLLSLLSLFVITRESVKFSASANLMDGNGVKSGEKNWRLVASDGTISINRTNRARNRESGGGGIEGVYIYIYTGLSMAVVQSK